MDEIFTRRSIRSYLPKEVEEEKIEAVLNAGNYAPSALNNQERQFTVLLNRDILGELNEAVFASCNQETRTRITERMNGSFSFFYQAPVLIVVSHRPDALAAPADCACALQNMFLQAHSLGLGTCWINQLNSLCDQTAVRAVLTRAGVPEEHGVFGCAALGYAAKEGKLLRPKENRIVFCK
jgi:nitroreductase